MPRLFYVAAFLVLLLGMFFITAKGNNRVIFVNGDVEFHESAKKALATGDCP